MRRKHIPFKSNSSDSFNHPISTTPPTPHSELDLATSSTAIDSRQTITTSPSTHLSSAVAESESISAANSPPSYSSHFTSPPSATTSSSEMEPVYPGGQTFPPPPQPQQMNYAQAQPPPTYSEVALVNQPTNPYGTQYGNQYGGQTQPIYGQPVAPPQQYQPGPVPPPDLKPMIISEDPSAYAKVFNVDAHGQLRVSNRPGCMMTCFMCPFPFFCLGCCLSESNDLVFDDVKQTITISSWPGHCFCCKGAPITIPYNQVGNIVASPGNMRINHQQAFNIYLVTKNGERYRLSDPDVMGNIQPTLLGYHRFLFGRAHPESYRPPTIPALQLFF